MQKYLVDAAEIAWQEGSPVSVEYQDIYWHRGSPLEEKSSVFVEPLLSLIGHPEGQTQVTVCELGFGFGLNCLLTAAAWSNFPVNCHLNFIAIEKHPLPPDLLRSFLADKQFAHADALLADWPPPWRGQHLLWLAPNIRLLLVLDDVESALGNLDANVDCWYLDGFAPARNAAMWQDRLYRMMFARSRKGARVATYSAAGSVRRGLVAAGFEAATRPGFGHKREMLTATRPGTWKIARHGGEKVMILGAGLAGSFCAEALERRNMEPLLVDSGEPGPSMIPQLSVLPQLAKVAETRYRLSLSATQYMRSAPGFHASGLEWFGRSRDEMTRLREIAAIFPDEAIETRDESVYFHLAGWLAFSEVQTALKTPVKKFRVTGIKPGWRCFGDAGSDFLEADHLILATGYNASLLPEQLQIRAIRGQAISAGTSDVRHVINGLVTIFPGIQGRSVISGTYEVGKEPIVREEDTARLIFHARKYARIDDSRVLPWAAVRAVSRDRLPIVGAAPDWNALPGVNRISDVTEMQPGLHYCTALGSRGATHARLLAEHLVGKLLGEPGALGLKEQQLLAPARFVIRDQNRPS